MGYKDLRWKFAQMSGRYDLVDPTTYEDAGADFFFNAGQKMLDRMQETSKSMARSVSLITAGTYFKALTNVRNIQEVWVGTTAEGLVQLEQKSLNTLRAYYEEQFADIDQGTPAYWAPACFRPYPDTQTAAAVSGYYDIGDLILDDGHYTYNGVVFTPPADTSYYLAIFGLFHSPTLTATMNAVTEVWTETTSYWLEEHPDLLLYAALYKLETFYRNTEGAKDWMNAMKTDLIGIDHDMADQVSANVNQMEG